MRRCTAHLAMLLTVIALLVACSGGDDGDDDGGDDGGEPLIAASPEATPTPTDERRTPDATAANPDDTETPAPAAAVDLPAVADTERPREVLLRSSAGNPIPVVPVCADDDASTATPVPSGSDATFISFGTADCAGWGRVSFGADTGGWVQLRYVIHPDVVADAAVHPGATWQDMLDMLDADDQECVRAVLTATEISGLSTTVLAPDAPPPLWAERFVQCVPPVLGARLSLSTFAGSIRALGVPLSLEMETCIGAVALEIAHRDNRLSFWGHPSSDELDALADAMVYCAGRAIAGILAAPLALDPAVPSDAVALDCIARSSDELRVILSADPEALAVGTELLLRCAPEAVLDVLVTALEAQVGPLDDVAVECLRERDIAPRLMRGVLADDGPDIQDARADAADCVALWAG